MVKIPLTQGYFAIVDDEDAQQANYKWHATVKPHAVYAARTAYPNGKHTTLYLHREIMDAPAGVQVDHIDGDGLNNCRSNLRLASRSENLRNSRLYSHNTTGFKGVSWHKREHKFIARIHLNGKLLHLGVFTTAEEAAAAYDRAAIELFGEFALTNAVLREREREKEAA